ncbi:MAG: P13 family porin, partial [Sphaerochaetaceae bacterium]
VAIYEETHLKISSPLWRNLLIGFGAGSKSQGDLAGEITGQILDWSSLSLVGVGAGLFLIEFIMLGMFGQSVDFQNPDELTNLSLYMMGGGAALFVLGRIIQAILPAIYGSRFNKTLREGLNLTKDMSDKVALGVSLDPAISLDKEPQLGVRLVANLAIAP